MISINLSGKTAIVGGSTDGIGKAIARLMADAGATVILLSRNEKKLKETLSELSTPLGQQHLYVAADFDQPDILKQNITSFLQQYKGSVHILVNNSGGPPAGPITTATEEEFIRAFHRLLIANHILATAVLPRMQTAGWGRIINVISTSVKQPLWNLGVSNTIRGAVANWAKTWANEVGKYNITVNNLLPGATETERLASLLSSKAEKEKKPVEMIKDQMLREIPMKRFASPEEIAHAALFLASDLASYINGINLPVDGGRTACL